MNKQRFLALAALVLFAGPPPASAQSSSLAGRLPTVSTWTLDNGLRVAYMSAKEAPVVSVHLWYHVGSKDEARSRRGSAHMFEHMMFKGTKRVRPEEHARHVNRVGGSVNAFTTEDATAYHNTLPKQYLDFAVQLEAERMHNLLFRPDMIDTEREVVKEEIRQTENQPIQRGFLRFLELAYTTHPYAWTAGGAIEDLDKTSPQELESFYRRYYVPNNALLVVVGDVSEAEVRASAKRHFASIPAGKSPPRPAGAATEPPQVEERRLVEKESQLGIVVAGYHVPEATHADVPALRVLSAVLSQGQSSRLHRRLVRRDKSAVFAGGQALIREHPGMYLVFAAFLDAKQQAQVEQALHSEVKRLSTQLVSAKELAKAKRQLEAEFLYGLEGVNGLAQQIGFSWIQSGDPSRFLSGLSRLRAVVVSDIRRVAKAYLNGKNRTVLVIPPKGSPQ